MQGRWTDRTKKVARILGGIKIESTKVQVAMMLSRCGIASSALCYRTLYRGDPFRPREEHVRKELTEAKATLALILSMQPSTSLTTSNASFFFVMDSRILLLSVVKI